MFLTLNQLNDQIECLSKEKHTVPQIILWQFMAGRLLERISLSRYADRIILKSGLLEIFIIGLEVRSLPGMGTAAHSPPLTVADAVNITSDIINTPLDDHMSFWITKAELDTAGTMKGAVRLWLDGLFDGRISLSPIRVELSSCGSLLFPQIRNSYPLPIEKRKIKLMAYPSENSLTKQQKQEKSTKNVLS